MHTLIVGQNSGNEFKVYHMAVYPEKPSQQDIDVLREELMVDQEFEMCDLMDDMEIRYLFVSKEE